MSWLKDLAGRGPDAYLEALFEPNVPTDTAGLRAQARRIGLPGFEHRTLPGDLLAGVARSSSTNGGWVEVFADRHHARGLFDNLTGKVASNIWIYAVVTVTDTQLRCEHGYAMEDAELVAAELRLVEALTAPGSSPELRSWSIEYGGQGYEGGAVCAGHGAEALRAYLALGR